MIQAPIVRSASRALIKVIKQRRLYFYFICFRLFWCFSFFYIHLKKLKKCWWIGCRGSFQKRSTKHADTNWIGNVTPGKPFPRQLFSAGREVKSTKKKKRRLVCKQTLAGLIINEPVKEICERLDFFSSIGWYEMEIALLFSLYFVSLNFHSYEIVSLNETSASFMFRILGFWIGCPLI